MRHEECQFLLTMYVHVGRLVPGLAAVPVPLPVRPRAGGLDGRDADARASRRFQAEQEAPSRVTIRQNAVCPSKYFSTRPFCAAG